MAATTSLGMQKLLVFEKVASVCLRVRDLPLTVKTNGEQMGWKAYGSEGWGSLSAASGAVVAPRSTSQSESRSN
jgi:hypothetical protein